MVPLRHTFILSCYLIIGVIFGIFFMDFRIKSYIPVGYLIFFIKHINLYPANVEYMVSC
jgi:hypothetical protein